MAWSLASGPVSRDVADIHAYPTLLNPEGNKVWARRPGCSYTLTPMRVRHLEPTPNSIFSQRRRLPLLFSPERSWRPKEMLTFPTRVLQITSCALGASLEYQLLRPRSSVSTTRQCCHKGSLSQQAPE